MRIANGFKLKTAHWHIRFFMGRMTFYKVPNFFHYVPFIFVNYIHNFVIFMFELFRQKINVNFNIQIYSYFLTNTSY